MVNSSQLESIVMLIENGDIEEAEEMAAKVRESSPDNGRLLYISGEIALLLEKPEEAYDFFISATEIMPKSAEAWGGLSEAASTLGEYQTCFEAGYQGMQLGILTPKQIQCVGVAMALLGEEEAGKALLLAQSEEEPLAAESWLGLGAISMMQQDITAAQEYYEKSLSMDANLYEAHAGLGALHMQEKEFEFAVDNFAKAIEIKPNYLPAYEGIIESLWQLGNVEECLEICDSLLEWQPLNRVANFRRGMCLFSLKRNDEGEKHLRENLKDDNDPENVDAAVFLGGYLDSTGKHEEAIEYYKQALLYSKDPRISERLKKLIVKE